MKKYYLPKVARVPIDVMGRVPSAPTVETPARSAPPPMIPKADTEIRVLEILFCYSHTYLRGNYFCR